MKQFKLVDNILGWLAFLLQPSYIVAPLSRQPVLGLSGVYYNRV